MSGFALTESLIALPRGAFARSHRRMLTWQGSPVLAFTQGRQRPYVFPLFSPAGFLLTSESPADHPHHNSLWIAADHVHGQMSAAQGSVEEYTYNFYVDETFQGRAAGRLVETALDVSHADADSITLSQSVDWLGPVEWAAPDGRAVLRETRSFTVRHQPGCHVIDIASRLSTTGWDVKLGPTRHAYCNLRVAETIAVAARITDQRGVANDRLPDVEGAAWIDVSGPVGGGHQAGLALFPDPRDHADLSWFVADWGVVTVGPFRRTGRLLRAGDVCLSRYRILAHDGLLDGTAAYGQYLDSLAAEP